jgi:hypothetical protein
MAHILIAAFGLMFLLDAADKALHFTRFTTSLSAYELLPAGMTCATAIALGLAGFLVGAALLGAIAVVQAAAGGSALLLLFAAGMAINLARGRKDLECGCGTAASGQRLQWRLVARNVVLACVLLIAATVSSHAAPLRLIEVLPAAFGLALVYLAVSAVWASGSQQQFRLGSL